ncbi:G1/S-specific cyclin-E2 isoform X2 [Erpetoichthys calabaricus]|uniref:Cyclin E2 n=2 Tax=Erpetoichthys calabaricus TaxID=27687 RepID=A0A8C4T287_ERPCA|nr:G1/S-specific cyclin-E2 isoform X2 [Erpetoichthys calabaricus]XP_028673457.1 G1/S-specific cyclin-E2 isoform X2 [Erpetoichthys calabaricus]
MSRRSVRLQARNEIGCPPRINTTRKRRCEIQIDEPELTVIKKHNYEIQSCWAPGVASPCILIETPHKEIETTTTDFSGFKQYRFKNLFIKPSPLPHLSWANSDDVWIRMLNKEVKYTHNKGFLYQHPMLQPKMRAILLDWLLEVCEVYALHRETFYLAQDFFDRFMVTQENINKNMLQLIGISTLFIASKIEEIYPPKLHEFAYVTDGACSVEEIIDMELIILKALNWDLCPETIISWLKLYIQMASLDEERNVLLPQFPQETFIQVAQLLDLCILDINCLEYQYGVLAAAAFYHYTSFELVQKVSGLDWDSISNCVNWMLPFVQTIKGDSTAVLKEFKKTATEDSHNIQTHTNYLAMLDAALKKQTEVSPGCLSPASLGGILTPPKSTEKLSSCTLSKQSSSLVPYSP